MVILPDHDRLGAAHALKVAADMDGVINVKIVTLPHLNDKEDVVDYLADGHTIGDLLALTLAAVSWDPKRMATERDARRKAKTLARVRRHRARKRQQWVALGSDWTEDSDTERRLRFCNAVTV